MKIKELQEFIKKFPNPDSEVKILIVDENLREHFLSIGIVIGEGSKGRINKTRVLMYAE